MRVIRNVVLFSVFISLFMVSAPGSVSPAFRGKSDVPYKVYVILGMHANFYHSWRGDTPDEAGFGTDIRVVREVLRMLDEANAKGLDARAYWEGESLFTFEDIIPNYAPDIIRDIRRRIEAGHDEFMPAPYSNTLFSALTEDEMRSVVRWSVSNPWGSGAKDLFGDYVPFTRPQEGMGTTGQVPVLLDEGMEGLVYAYSNYSFTTFSNFVKPLPPEQRYGLTWMRMQEGGPRIKLFPCVSAADVVNFISMEKWLLKLRKMQTTGKVKKDLVIHINFDADAETWLPMLPPPLSGFPNAGGLPEYIKDVNKYEWAEFTVPSEYLAEHEPVGEVLIKQDLADGGWDGNYSWAEKYPSHMIWTDLEKSRLYTRHAEALMKEAPDQDIKKADDLLYNGRDSSFFQRLRGLSTTHFGMSTPLVNEQRQAVAEKVVHETRDYADRARRLLAEAVPAPEQKDTDLLYSFRLEAPPEDKNKGLRERTARNVLRLPVVLDAPLPGLKLLDGDGKELDFSLVDVEDLDRGRVKAELLAVMELAPGESKNLELRKTGEQGPESPAEQTSELENDRLSLNLDEKDGVQSLKVDGVEVGGPEFLSHFITYRTDKEGKSYYESAYQRLDLSRERRQGMERAGLATEVPFRTPHGEAVASIEIRFTLPDDAPWLLADVEVNYPYTKKEDIIHTMQQKLRRYLDLDWIEVAPFQLHPVLDSSRADPVRVWKHNWLDVTSYYDMNYAKINPENNEWDSMNHQVTAGWVAVSDQSKGLLIGQNAEVLSSYAFAPMRLREDKNKNQKLWINPFGSYHGEQMDYSHLGGTGVGSDIANMASAALRPNGPSYNGKSESFSLILAPYKGDQPPKALQEDAEAFFYPPAVVYTKTPDGVDASFKEDVHKLVEKVRIRQARKATGPIPEPRAFLVNPTEKAADVVWDQPPDPRVEGYEIQYKKEDETSWKTVKTGPGRRHHIEPLQNEEDYLFRMRSAGMGKKSDWTETIECEIGPVETGGVLSAGKGASLGLVNKMLYYSWVHLLTTP
ncbi:MAG: fibronectin type III domain-containing protein [bacterium]